MSSSEGTLGLNDSSALVSLGYALLNPKRHAEALAACEQALRLDPTSARAYNNKGVALGNLKRYAEALAVCEQALRLNYTDTWVMRWRNETIEKLKKQGGNH